MCCTTMWRKIFPDLVWSWVSSCILKNQWVFIWHVDKKRLFMDVETLSAQGNLFEFKTVLFGFKKIYISAIPRVRKITVSPLMVRPVLKMKPFPSQWILPWLLVLHETLSCLMHQMKGPLGLQPKNARLVWTLFQHTGHMIHAHLKCFGRSGWKCRIVPLHCVVLVLWTKNRRRGKQVSLPMVIMSRQKTWTWCALVVSCHCVSVLPHTLANSTIKVGKSAQAADTWCYVQFAGLMHAESDMTAAATQQAGRGFESEPGVWSCVFVRSPQCPPIVQRQAGEMNWRLTWPCVKVRAGSCLSMNWCHPAIASRQLEGAPAEHQNNQMDAWMNGWMQGWMDDVEFCSSCRQAHKMLLTSGFIGTWFHLTCSPLVLRSNVSEN